MKKRIALFLALILIACAVCGWTVIAPASALAEDLPDGTWKMVRMAMDGIEADETMMEEGGFYGYVVFLSGNRLAMIVNITGETNYGVTTWTQEKPGEIVLDEGSTPALGVFEEDRLILTVSGMDMTFVKMSGGAFPAAVPADGMQDFEGTWEGSRVYADGNMFDVELFFLEIYEGTELCALSIENGLMTASYSEAGRNWTDSFPVSFSDGALAGDGFRLVLYDSGEIGMEVDGWFFWFVRNP